ncbi:MAG: sensor histidine kinase [Fimbriimonas sp.]
MFSLVGKGGSAWEGIPFKGRAGATRLVLRLGAVPSAIGVGFIVLAATQITSYGLYSAAREELRDEIRTSMQRRVQMAAATVDSEAHRRLTSPAHETTATYREALKPLARFQAANDDVRYVYTCVLRAGKVFFVLDPTQEGDHDGDGVDDKSHVMEPYESPSAAMLATLRTGRSHVDAEPTKDGWGTFLSAFAPLKDASGRQIGVVGIDLTADTYAARLGQARTAYLRTIGICVLIALAVGYASYRFFRWVAGSVDQMATSELVSAQREVLERVVQSTDGPTILAFLCGRVEALCERGLAAVVLQEGSAYRFVAGSLPIGWSFSPPDGEGALATEAGTSGWACRIPREEGESTAWLTYIVPHPGGVSVRERQALEAMAHVAALAFREVEARAAMKNARDRALITAITKNEFLANMSHEIRTPMNGVIGMADLLLETHLKPDQRDCVETIASSSNALLHIIDDILNLAKLEAGKVDLERVAFDLTALVARLAITYDEQAWERGVAFEVFFDTAYGNILVGDPTRLEQIVGHLLGNAVKFTESGTITLEVASRPEGIRITVRDTGCGIPEERLASIFEPFTQADGSSTRRFGGTGLGLTVCHRLVSLMGGTIEVESEVARGSAFTVSLPHREAA